jgi:hypothetical protein
MISCRVVNVSSTGARIRSEGFIPSIGSPIDIEVETGNGKITVSGVVRWSDREREGFGIEFGALSRGLDL